MDLHLIAPIVGAVALAYALRLLVAIATQVARALFGRARWSQREGGGDFGQQDAGREGYERGVRDAQRRALGVDPVLLRDAVSLCHPDRHPPERAEVANRVTADLLAALSHERRD